MSIILENLSWMFINISLALVGVVFSYLLLNSKKPIPKLVFLILWLLYDPNTIYLISDLQYLPEQIVKVNILGQLILLAQFLTLFILGIFTFLFSLKLFEKSFYKSLGKGLITLALITLNFLIGFAVVLGKLERINSWDVFLRPQQVVLSSLNLFSSKEMVIIIIFLGLLSNILYFSLRKAVKLPIKI